MRSSFASRSTSVSTWLSGDRHLAVTLYSAVIAVVLVPLTVIDIPLIADYPNHLARMYILGNIIDDPLLAERYGVNFDFIPNLVMDFVVPRLAALIPLELAGRLFLAMTLLSTLFGVAWLHRILFNRWSLWPLVAALFLYHGSLLAGLVNFSFGIGATLIALAVWIDIRHRPIVVRLLIGSGLALILYFCHLVALGAYGLLVAGYESVRGRDKWSRRDGPGGAITDGLVAAATLAIPALLFVGTLSNNAGGDGWSIVYGNWPWKMKALLAPLANYDPTLDVASFVILLGLMFWGWRSGRVEIDRRMAPGLGLLALAFALAPKALLAGGVFDQRFAVLLAFLLVAASDVRARGGRIEAIVPLVLSALFLTRMGILTATWIDHRADLAEVRAAIEQVRPGGRILVVEPDRTAGLRRAPRRHRVFHHAPQMASLATLAVIEKSALVSTIYAVPGQHPLTLAEPYRALAGDGPASVPTLTDLRNALAQPTSDNVRIGRWWLDFDYLLVIYGYGPSADAFRSELPVTTLLDGEIMDLFRIDRR